MLISQNHVRRLAISRMKLHRHVAFQALLDSRGQEVLEQFAPNQPCRCAVGRRMRARLLEARP